MTSHGESSHAAAASDSGADCTPSSSCSPAGESTSKPGSKRSRVCLICDGPTETFHLNYGISSCFSCRAFFRRVVQKGNSSKLKCKASDECQLAFDSQKKCRKCRFEKCVAAGMNADGVLKEDQKKERFKKHFSKQLREEGADAALPVGLLQGKRKRLELEDVPEDVLTGVKLRFKRKKQPREEKREGATQLGRKGEVGEAQKVAEAALPAETEIKEEEEDVKVEHEEDKVPSCSSSNDPDDTDAKKLSKSAAPCEETAENSPFPKNPTSGHHPRVESALMLAQYAARNQGNNSSVGHFGHQQTFPGNSSYPTNPLFGIFDFHQFHGGCGHQPTPSHWRGAGRMPSSHWDANQQQKQHIEPAYTRYPKGERFLEQFYGIGNHSHGGPPSCCRPINNPGNCHAVRDERSAPAYQCTSNAVPKQRHFSSGEDLSASRTPANPSTLFESSHTSSNSRHTTSFGNSSYDHGQTDPFKVSDATVVSGRSTSEGIDNPNPTSTQAQAVQVVGRGKIDALTLKGIYEFFLLPGQPFGYGRTLESRMLEQLHQSFSRNPDVFNMTPTTNLEIQHIVKTWSMAAERVHFDRKIIEGFVALHRAGQPMDRELVKQGVLLVSKLLRDFAIQQPFFGQLSEEKQRHTLLQGARRMVQYLLGQYLTCSSGGEQVAWILKLCSPLDNLSQEFLLSCQFLSLQSLNQMMSLFKDELKYAMFYGNIQAFQGMKLPEWCNGLVAAILVFGSPFAKGHSTFEATGPLMTTIEHLLQAAAVSNDDGAEKLSIRKILSACDSMAALFEQQLDFVDEMALVSIVSEVFQHFSHGEELWLDQKTRLITENFAQVDMGTELLKQYVMYSVGVPLNHEFGMLAGLAFRERLKRTLVATEEFQTISNVEQATMLQANILDAYSILIAKLCCLTDGRQQMALAMGAQDIALYNREFKSVVGEDQLIKVDITSMNGDNSIMSAETEARFCSLVQTIGKFVLCESRFKELLLLTLLSDDYVKNPCIKVGYNRVFTAMYRKCASSLGDDGESGGEDGAMAALAGWRRITRDVKEFSQLLYQYFIVPQMESARAVATAAVTAATAAVTPAQRQLL